jgi:hypothetical protein
LESTYIAKGESGLDFGSWRSCPSSFGVSSAESWAGPLLDTASILGTPPTEDVDTASILGTSLTEDMDTASVLGTPPTEDVDTASILGTEPTEDVFGALGDGELGGFKSGYLYTRKTNHKVLIPRIVLNLSTKF